MHAHPEAAIRERAYAIWEQEGRPDGREWLHWERASSEILATRPAPQPAKAAAKASTPSRVAKAKGRIRAALTSATA